MCSMYASFNYFIYSFLFMCFCTFFIVYSSYSNYFATHGVGIHTFTGPACSSRYTETYHSIIIGVYSLL